MTGTYLVTITYGGQTQTFNINVTEPPVSTLSLNYDEVQTNYYVGDTFDPSGLVVTANYNNGTNYDVINYNVEIYDQNQNIVTDFAIAGTYNIVVSYGGQTQSFNVTVEEVALDHIEAEVANNRVLRYTEFDKSNVTVYACYNNGTRVDVTSDANFYIFSTSQVGIVRGTVNYQYNYRTTYEVEVYEKPMVSVDFNTDNAKTEYQIFEQFTRDGIVVTAYYDDGTSAILRWYASSIYNSENEAYNSSSFDEIGAYTVKLKVSTFENQYDINVISTNPFTVTFGYSGCPYDEFQYTFVPGVPVDPAPLIPNIPGYFFTGFSQFDWDNPQPDHMNFVKLYYEQFDSRYYFVSFVNNYERFYMENVNRNTNFDINSINYIPTKKGYQFIGWDLNGISLTPVRNNYMIFAKFAKIEDDVDTSVSYNSTGTLITLNLDSNIQYEYHVTLTNGSNSIDITDASTTLSLASGEYTISGYVMYTNDDGSHIRNIAEYTFENNYPQTFRQLSQNNVQVVTYSNAIVVGTEEYVANAPDGYRLDTIALYDENENLVAEQAYNGEFSLTFYSLNPGSYRVDAFYSDATSQIALFDVTPGYRIHFVGYFVHTNSSNVIHRIQLFYQGEILYTQYYGDNSFPYNVFRFVLPIKYENYVIAGSLDYKDTITQDEDWELILAGVPSNKHKVIYYKYNSDEFLSYSELDNVSQRQDPQIDASFVDKSGTFKYTFKYFTEYNVNGDLLLRPYYESEPIPGDMSFELCIYLAYNHLYVSTSYYGPVSLQAKYRIIGGEYVSGKSIYNDHTAMPVSPNTEYLVSLEYSYEYDGNAYNNTISRFIKTPASNRVDSTCANIEIEKTYHSISYSSESDVAGFEAYRTIGNDIERNFYYTPARKSGMVNYLVQNTTYNALYFMKEADGIYYAYDIPDITTLDVAKPSISKIVITRKTDGYYGTIYGTIPSDINTTLRFNCYVEEIQKSYSQNLNYSKSGSTYTFKIADYTNQGVRYDTTVYDGYLSYIYDGKVVQLNMALFPEGNPSYTFEFNQ